MRKKFGKIICLVIIFIACICGVCLSFTDEELEIINQVEDERIREDLLNANANYIDWNQVKSWKTSTTEDNNIILENTSMENTNIENNYSINGIDNKGCIEETSNEETRIIHKFISCTITIAYFGGKYTAILLIAIGICKKISANRKFKLYEEKLNTNKEDRNTYENDEEWKELKKKKDKSKNFLVFCIILGIILLTVSGLANILRTFAAKPIIYIYPENETEVSVKLGNPDKITCSYPKYEGEWSVKASPNGDLVDLKTGRNLYSLYWEGINTNSSKIKDGFVVKGEDTAKFLEEKLEILGLNEREAEEFIIYWLPKMEKNNYNYIRFETIEEINENMPLEINPKPDTLIRVMMDFKGLRKPIDIETQILEKAERNGYTVVEWGGTEL